MLLASTGAGVTTGSDAVAPDGSLARTALVEPTVAIASVAPTATHNSLFTAHLVPVGSVCTLALSVILHRRPLRRVTDRRRVHRARWGAIHDAGRRIRGRSGPPRSHPCARVAVAPTQNVVSGATRTMATAIDRTVGASGR